MQSLFFINHRQILKIVFLFTKASFNNTLIKSKILLKKTCILLRARRFRFSKNLILSSKFFEFQIKPQFWIWKKHFFEFNKIFLQTIRSFRINYYPYTKSSDYDNSNNYITFYLYIMWNLFINNIDITTIKWLNKFDYEIKKYQNNENRFSFTKYLDYFNMLLIEDIIK